MHRCSDLEYLAISAHNTPEIFVSLSDLPKIKGLRAMCKFSLGTQDVRKGLILGMDVHYHMHPHVNMSLTFSYQLYDVWVQHGIQNIS